MFGGSAPAAAPGGVASMAGEAGTAIPGIGSTPAAGFGSGDNLVQNLIIKPKNIYCIAKAK